MNQKILISLKRRMLIRKLKHRWQEDDKLRRSARMKGWHGIVEVFHVERTYKEIREELSRRMGK